MTRSTPAPGRPAPPVEPRRGIEVGLLPLLASVVGLLLVAGVIGGAVWVTDEDAGGAGETTTAATQPAGAIAGPPDLQLESDGETFTYTVGHDQFQEGDVFRVQRGSSERVLPGAEPNRLEPGQTRLQSRVRAGNQECARARLVRGSQISAWSAVKCEKGAE